MGMVQHHRAMNRPAAPVCSVCIANYNGAALLADCLESVLAQQGNLSIEIIVHDDASTDDSLSLLRDRYPQVEVLASAQNVGFCIGNNRMAAHARGEYILLLNNDAALYPDALTTLLEAARAQPQPGILTLPQYDWATGVLVDRGCLLDPFYNPIPNLDPERQEVAMVIGACLFIPRSLWSSLHGFPEWLESIGEDLYLCCLARLHGAPVQVSVGSGYRHRQGASFGGNRVSAGQLQTTYRRRRLSERNKTFAMVVCTPTVAVWPLFAIHIIGLSMEGLFMTSAKRDLRLWREIYGAALRSTFTAMARLRSLRRDAQRQRCITLHGYFHPFMFFPQKLRLLKRHGIPLIR
jgi:GT2 family glycosyltransferase